MFSAFCLRGRWGESKNKKEGVGESKELETLVAKPLDFENPR